MALSSTHSTHPWTIFVEHFQCSSDEELNTSIFKWQSEAARSAGHPRMLTVVSELAELLHIRFLSHGSARDLEQSIFLHRQVLHGVMQNFNDDYVYHAPFLVRLGSALTDRWFQSKTHDDIATAIRHLEEALGLIPSDSAERPGALLSLAIALLRPERAETNLDTLARATSLLHEGISLIPLDHALYPHMLSRLGRVLRLSGTSDNYSESIALHTKAIGLCPEHHRSFPSMLTRFAISLRLNEATSTSEPRMPIRLCRQALALQSSSHPARCHTLSLLGFSLAHSYSAGYGSKDDLEEGISLLREGMQLLPAESEHSARMRMNLGSALRIRFEANQEDPSVLREIIDIYISALRVAKCTEDPCHDTILLNLAGVYELMYTRCGNRLQDINVAVSLTRKVLTRRPAGNAGRLYAINALATRSLQRPGIAPIELDDIIDMYDSAMRIDCPPGHSRRAVAQRHFGNVLYARFKVSGDPVYFRYCMAIYQSASDDESTTVPIRFEAMMSWIESAEDGGSFAYAILAYRRAILQLPAICYYALDLGSQLLFLKRAASFLPCRAAACALALGNTREAIYLLEKGRTIIWRKILQCRTDRFSTRVMMPTEYADDGRLYNHLPNANGEDQRIYRPEDAAQGGPVIILLCSKVHGAFAIIIPSPTSKVLHIPLPSVTVEGLRNTTEEIRQTSQQILLHDRKGRSRDICPIPLPAPQMNPLVYLWDKVAYPVITCLGIKRHGALKNRPRIWWCCTGVFSGLPIHAACGNRESLSDYAVSSYAHTLRSLISARTQLQHQGAITDVLLVAEPKPPDRESLENVEKELEAVCQAIPRSSRLQIRRTASSQEAIHGMQTASVLHLACHGEQDHQDALSSGFILRDGRLAISDITKLELPNAYFAFLSACESAFADRTHPDEAMHLAAAMVCAGFKSVVGTLWSMDDWDGPFVAGHVYRELFKEHPRLDPALIPFALDAAVRKLREQGVHWTCWATYVHVGI